MDIPKAMQAKLTAIRDATSLDELTPFLTTGGLQKPAAAMQAVQLGAMDPKDARKLLTAAGERRGVAQWRAFLFGDDDEPSDEWVDTAIAIKADRYLSTSIWRRSAYTRGQIIAIAGGKLPMAAYAICIMEPLSPELLRALATAPSQSDKLGGYEVSETSLPGMILSDDGNFLTIHPQIIVARHPNTPDDVREGLLKARSGHVREAAALGIDHRLPTALLEAVSSSFVKAQIDSPVTGVP
jgi:hypothetical protein